MPDYDDDSAMIENAEVLSYKFVCVLVKQMSKYPKNGREVFVILDRFDRFCTACVDGAVPLLREFDLNVGGLVGAVACVEGTGRLVTGTRNDECGTLLSLAHPENNQPAQNRLAVHTIRDTQRRILGLGAGGGGGYDNGDQGEGGAGWEPVTETWMEHESAVTGIAVVKNYGNGVDTSAILTSGGDGCVRLMELDLADDDDTEEESKDGEEDPIGGRTNPTLTAAGKVDVHKGERATAVAATRRRAVTVGEDGRACLVDLERLGGVNGQGIGVSGRSDGGRVDEGGAVFWRGQAKGGLPLSGVAFQGEQEEIFATCGCDPRSPLMLWDTRSNSNEPSARFDGVDGSVAPYRCVASQPFNPEVFACGSSIGEVFMWDVRLGEAKKELMMKGDDGWAGGVWGVAFHPRKPKNLLAVTGAGVLMKWLLPDNAAMPNGGGYRFGANINNASGGWNRSGERLHALPSRSAFVGVCYDEGADTVSAVSKHGSIVVAQGVPGWRL